MKTVVVLNTDQMGHGDPVLGQKILGTFLRRAASIPGLEAILFYNAGVKLLTAGSAHRSELTMLEESGIDLLACVTCIEHFGIELAAGTVSDMGSIMQEMGRAEKVITL
ncbi:MAG: DsrE family protein [Planctomycetota bacterium]